MLEVEIKGPYNQFYKVFLYNCLENLVEISVKNDSKSILSIPLPFVFRTCAIESPTNVKIGDEIEVYIQLKTPVPTSPANKTLSNDEEEMFSKLAVARNQLAWWPAQVHNIRGDYLVVRINGIANCTDVVDRTTVRSVIGRRNDSNLTKNDCTRLPIEYGSICKKVIKIPQELTQSSKDISVYKDLLRYCSSPATLFFDKHKSQLSIISFDADVIRQVELLEDTYLKMLRQKWNLLQSMNHATKKLELTRLANNKSANFVESFSIPQVCMGLAIGTKGANIQQARQIDDIVAIDVCDETCGFVIYAKSKDAIKAARKIIEYSEAVMKVPQTLVARIIGKSGSNIQSMVDKSGVIRVRIENNQRSMNKSATRRPNKPLDGRDSEHSKDPLDLLLERSSGAEACNSKADNTNAKIETTDNTNLEKVQLSTNNNDKESVNFVFIGNIESINNAKLLISFQVETLRELDAIQSEKAEIIRELNSVEGQNSVLFPSPMFHAPSYLQRSGPPNNQQSFAGNQRMPHPIKFAVNDNPFLVRHPLINNAYSYSGRYSSGNNNTRMESDYAGIANDEYSLAPGGPPSGSQSKGRYNPRYARDGSSPGGVGARHRPARDNYYVGPVRDDDRRYVNRRPEMSMAPKNEAASNLRVPHRMSNMEHAPCIS